MRRRCSTASTVSAPAVSASSASSSRDASASSCVGAPTPVPMSRARCRIRSRSTSVAVSRRRWRPPCERGVLIGLRRAERRDVEHVHHGSTQADRRAEMHRERAPEHVDLHVVADQAAPVRDRGRRARAGAARQGLARAPLPDPHRDAVGAVTRDELDVDPAGEPFVVLDLRAVGRHRAPSRDRRRTTRGAGCRCRPRRRGTSRRRPSRRGRMPTARRAGSRSART